MRLAVIQTGIDWHIVGYINDKINSCNVIVQILENNNIMNQWQFSKIIKRHSGECTHIAGQFWIYIFPTQETATAAMEEIEPLLLAATINAKGPTMI